jgi:hypothetical protein
MKHQLNLILPLLEKFLQCYPLDILSKNLRKIYLVDEAYIHGHRVAGTYRMRDKAIILAAYFELDYYAHHEFSSLLMRNYYNYEQVWTSYNKMGYVHHTEFKEMSGNKKLRDAGFLFDYSQVSFEEDFNVLAGYYFDEPKWLLEMSKAYPRILAKVKIIKKFYNKLSICSP